jgi:hypothetical protein
MKIKVKEKNTQEIIRLFKAHCEDGWSPRSFEKYLSGYSCDYQYLQQTSPEFYELSQKYSKAKKT